MKPDVQSNTADQPIEHWTVHYREWVASRPEIAKLGFIEQMEAYIKTFPEKAT